MAKRPPLSGADQAAPEQSTAEQTAPDAAPDAAQVQEDQPFDAAQDCALEDTAGLWEYADGHEEPDAEEPDVCALLLAEVKQQLGISHPGAEVRSIWPSLRGVSVELALSSAQIVSSVVSLTLSAAERNRILRLWMRRIDADNDE